MYVNGSQSRLFRKAGANTEIKNVIRQVKYTCRTQTGLIYRRRRGALIQVVSSLPSNVTKAEIEALNREELKAELRTRKQLLKGNKSELVARLWQELEQEQEQTDAVSQKSSKPVKTETSTKPAKKPTKQVKATSSESETKLQCKTKAPKKQEVIEDQKPKTESIAPTKKDGEKKEIGRKRRRRRRRIKEQR
eukprot:TRINITY_DN109_c0_g1_i5.p2 TRINITY_DN109_c0_g1~~TRINITY_DN109_c0_g1_i5.p2  ORF type:complete len:203 (-),score=32.53 TRINITY_DN109_c0_g1_i5:934-1509(-)